MPLGGQDKVVMHGNAHGPGSGEDLPGQLFVALGRLQASRRVIVGQDEPRGVEFQRPF